MSDPGSAPDEDVAPDGTSAEYCAYTEYRDGSRAETVPATGEGATGTAKRVWDALFEVEDPEMPISVVDLGLIYGVDVSAGHATVRMTLTYTGCPARRMLLADVEAAAAGADGVDSADVELVWSPEWNLTMVSDAGKEALREFGVSV